MARSCLHDIHDYHCLLCKFRKSLFNLTISSHPFQIRQRTSWITVSSCSLLLLYSLCLTTGSQNTARDIASQDLRILWLRILLLRWLLPYNTSTRSRIKKGEYPMVHITDYTSVTIMSMSLNEYIWVKCIRRRDMFLRGALCNYVSQ